MAATIRAAHREAAQCGEQALGALGHLPGDRATLEQEADIRFNLARALYSGGELAPALKEYERAEAAATRLGDQRRLAQVAAGLTYLLGSLGDHAGAIAAGERALTRASTLGDLPLQIWTSVSLGREYFATGEYRRGIERMRLAVAALEDRPVDLRFHYASLLPAVGARTWLALCLGRLGEFAEAIAWGDEAVRVAEALDAPRERVWAYFSLGRIHLGRGRLRPGPPAARAGAAALRGRALPHLPAAGPVVAGRRVRGEPGARTTRGVARARRGRGAGDRPALRPRHDPHPCRRSRVSKPAGWRTRASRPRRPSGSRAPTGSGATRPGCCTWSGASTPPSMSGTWSSPRPDSAKLSRSPRRSGCARSRRAVDLGLGASIDGRPAGPRARPPGAGDRLAPRHGHDLLARAGGGAPGRPPLTGAADGGRPGQCRRWRRSPRDPAGLVAIHAIDDAAHPDGFGRADVGLGVVDEDARLGGEPDPLRRPPVDLRLGLGHTLLRRRDHRVEDVVDAELAQAAAQAHIGVRQDRGAVRRPEPSGQRDVGPDQVAGRLPGLVKLGRGRPARSSSSRCASARHARRSPWPRSIRRQVAVRYRVSRRAWRGSPCVRSSPSETSHRMSISTPPKSKMTPRMAGGRQGSLGGRVHDAVR